jgi:acyl carrier protein
MTRQEAFERLQGVFDKLFLTPVKLVPTLTASQVSEWDSLMQINVVIATEKAFGVRFRVGEPEKAGNVGEFVDLVLERLRER